MNISATGWSTRSSVLLAISRDCGFLPGHRRSISLEKGTGVIGDQVVQEFLNAATRKFAVPLRLEDAKKYLDIVLEPLCEVFSRIELYQQALEIAAEWRFSFYDALIVAAALQAECGVLYSEDL
jgi:predicted nucleic acid-binding protein